MTDGLKYIAMAVDVGFQLGRGEKVDLEATYDKHFASSCATCCHLTGPERIPFCDKTGRPIEHGEESEQVCGCYVWGHRITWADAAPEDVLRMEQEAAGPPEEMTDE